MSQKPTVKLMEHLQLVEACIEDLEKGNQDEHLKGTLKHSVISSLVTVKTFTKKVLADNRVSSSNLLKFCEGLTSSLQFYLDAAAESSIAAMLAKIKEWKVTLQTKNGRNRKLLFQPLRLLVNGVLELNFFLLYSTILEKGITSIR
eukprot:m.71191 g.71191  ORF g.71191 m.71191 type:complete len:146 (+) comp35736_c0_seq6:598-1035(+)